ncbi:hypothetical protein GS399_07230 [Pedobacter sp. HMF7647]|uniref:DUF5683 domain-containing protein n=1 Tax=Hufsiella arboris TaxID=2695275 RepID=A0A7K1Y8R2_9SPHI|nr:DUF5683 domain-containing protein [Hufsiella arboris]MXV50761.1 hypothetical protein [Hufsiella arboris]
MRFLTLLVALLLFVSLNSAKAQINNSAVKVDTTMRRSGVKTVDTLPRPENQPIVKAKKQEVVKDSARLALEAMPRRATLRSLVVPGWGQITNRRYWKLPIVYAGYVGLGLAINFNQKYYKEILTEVQNRTNYPSNEDENGNPYYTPNPKYAPYSTQSLTDAKDFYRRNRDLSILGLVAFHAIQTIDAYVDAKFFRYDISDELSLKVSPSIQQAAPSSFAFNVPVPSLKLTLSL